MQRCTLHRSFVHTFAVLSLLEVLSKRRWSEQFSDKENKCIPPRKASRTEKCHREKHHAPKSVTPQSASPLKVPSPQSRHCSKPSHRKVPSPLSCRYRKVPSPLSCRYRKVSHRKVVTPQSRHTARPSHTAKSSHIK